MIGEGRIGNKSGKGGGSSLSKGTWMLARQMEGEKSGVQVGGAGIRKKVYEISTGITVSGPVSAVSETGYGYY